MQALKSFVWIEFVACKPPLALLHARHSHDVFIPLSVFFTASFTLRYAITEHRRGRTQVWSGPLSRYVPRDQPQRNEFLRQTTTDYFGARGGSAFEKI